MHKSGLLHLLTWSYGLLVEKKWMPSHLFTPMRGGLRRIAMKVLPTYFLRNPVYLDGKQYDDLIVSITSFPARINYVYFVIESILRQTILPHKIILWLSKEQFSGLDSLPESLTNLQSHIFEIHFVDGDIRSHKKYYYASKEFPDYLIVLIDDDILYPPGMLEELHEAYDLHKGDVICRYGCRVSRDIDGNLKPYEQWPHIYCNDSGDEIFFGSGGGTLFCPKDFIDELTDIDKAIRITPYADDIWLNAMTRMSHLKITILKHGRFFPLNISDSQPLVKINVEERQNDQQLKNIISQYRENKLFLK